MKTKFSILQPIKAFFIRIVICRFWLFKKTYYFIPFIYVDDNDNVVKNEITDKLKWLEKEFTITDYCYKDAEKKAFIKINEQYKEYKNAIWFF